MLEEFRKLGGTADNFVQRQGSRGRGIFPIDNTKPVRLRVPRNLLIPAEDIEFVDDELKIRNSADVGAAERAFVEKYENAFSWGGGGRSACAAFLEGMKNLHVGTSAQPFVKSFLDAAKTSVDESVGHRFLHSRCITFEDKSVLMPVMELVNHDPLTNGYDVEDDISIEGVFSDEVLVRYSIRDPFGMFLTYGFASPEPMAFSLPFEVDTIKLVVNRNINMKGKLGSFNVPKFTIEEGKVTLSALMIGNSRAPRLPKSIFLSILEKAGCENAVETFEYNAHQNRMTYLGLLELMEARDADFALTVRKMLYFQLQAISHCYGTRTL